MSFKKYYFVVFFFFVAATSSFSQESSPPTATINYKGAFEFGFQHSINLTTLVGKNNSYRIGNRIIEINPVGRRLTFDIGMFSHLYLSRKFSIDFEILYSYMGSPIEKKTTVLHDLGEISGSENCTYAFQYFKFPVILKAHPTEKFSVEFGGYIATLLAANERYRWESGTGYSRESLDGISSYDAGIVAGVGFDMKILNLGFRYNYGLVNVFEEKGTLDLRNSVFQVVAQWKLYSDIKKQM